MISIFTPVYFTGDTLMHNCGIVNHSAVVSFSPSMTHRALELWPWLEARGNLHEISQAVTLADKEQDLVHGHHTSLKDALRRYHNSRDDPLEYSTPEHIFLLVAGLRPTKDVLYLTTAFSAWHTRPGREKTAFVIVGPVLDEIYAKEVETTVAELPGVYLLPAVEQSVLHMSYLPDATMLVNSSKTEVQLRLLGQTLDVLPGLCLLKFSSEYGCRNDSVKFSDGNWPTIHSTGDVRSHPGGNGPGRSGASAGYSRQRSLG